MKKVRLIMLIILGSFTFNSCSDWLYLEPQDGIIVQEFWKSKEDVEAAVMGCYASLLGNNQGSGYDIPQLLFLWGELRADMVTTSRLNSDFQYVVNGDILPDNTLCQWGAFYRTINYCNTVLHYAKGVQDVDPSFTTKSLHQYESEAYGLRALMYFYLVRVFDEIPLKTNATTNDGEQFAIPKSSRTEIFNQIKSDLKKAEEYAPESYGDIASNKGRLTKYAVNAIQADVYLWTEQYDSALLACNKVIESGKYALVNGDKEWFTTLYGAGNSVESIFELQFSQDKQNPYYYLFRTRRYLVASPVAIEEYFPQDEFTLPQDADVRADGGSYKSSDNYSIWKYLGINREDLRAENESWAHFIIYRYADILLMKAEALSQMGRGQEALDLIYRIRSRAKASKASDVWGGATDKTSVNEFLLAERAREFAYEGKRWFDILRFARRNHYERKQLLIDMVLKSAPADKQLTIKNKYEDTLSHYMPVYVGELDANPALVQNPFYETQQNF